MLACSAQTGAVVFATGSSLFELQVPHGRFTLEVQLQMNVQPGIYLVDIGVYDRADERQLFAGPGLTLRVTEGRLYLGPVNLNARMDLQAPDVAGTPG